MRVLLDENLDWRLARDLPGHEVASVPRIGWSGIANGELLARANGIYNVLITMDVGIGYQQNATKYKIAVIVLQAPSNRLADTRPLMAKVLRELEHIEGGTIVAVQ